MNSRPFVSALIVTRNEELFIEKALLSLINQSYPKYCYEIIVVDGESTDETINIVDRLIEAYRTESFSIYRLENQKKILAAGWNIGIKAAKGDYVVRIDAHAEADRDFLEKSVETITNIPDAICVGGKIITMAQDGDNPLVSKVLSSSFGVGNSAFRVSNTPGYSDTAVYGLYKKEIFDEVGYFNERFERNQDIELHSRIKEKGYKFYFNPEIKTIYYSRNTVSKMISQALGNGKWNMILLKCHSSALSLRHLVPFVFVIYLLISAVLGLVNRFFWIQELGILLLHMIIGLSQGIKNSDRPRDILIIPWLFLILHISYGVGYFQGIIYSISGEK